MSAGRPGPALGSPMVANQLPPNGALSEGSPEPPDWSPPTDPRALGTSPGPTPSASLPPLPAPVLEGASRFEKIDPEEAAVRQSLQQERRELEALLRENVVERNEVAAARQELGQVQRARNAGTPPAHGSDSTLIDPHREPPFDPGVRRELGRQPRQVRSRVARRDSVLYDQIGARKRVNESGERLDAAIARQREVGRREFEMRQRREADGSRKSAARAEQRRVEEFQRLEASDAAEVLTRARARRQAIQDSAAQGGVARESAATFAAESTNARRSRGQELFNAAQQRHNEVLNTTSNARSAAVTARQRDVFQLQLQYANTRRLARENPPEATGDESQKRLAQSRGGGEIFQTLKDTKQGVLNRVEQGRVSDVAAKDRRAREFDGGRLDRARERSQNIRRRLDSSYGGQANKQVGQRVGRSA